jgi:hypothetical protein
MAFAPDTTEWSSVDTAPMMAIERTRLTLLEDGGLILNGAIRDDPSYTLIPGGGSAMTSIDLASGKATLLDGVSAFAYSVRPGGTVDYIDGVTGEAKVATTDGQNHGTDARMVLDGLHPVRDVMTGDAKGVLWLWESGQMTIDVIRVDTETGETSSYAYPLIESTLHRAPAVDPDVFAESIGRRVVLSPELSGLIIDNRGDLWVVSANTKAYPALYRLRIEEP